MGLFSWLFGKASRVKSRDAIWLTDAARLAGAARTIDAHLDAGRTVLVLAHFPATLASFGEHVTRPGRPHGAVPSELTPAAALKLAEAEPRVLYGLVRNLRPDDHPPPDDAPPSPLPVLVLERHFLREHDDRVVRFAEGLGGRADVEFHASLDDPLMKLFVGEWVRTTLRQLGAKEDEAIDSAMVARRLAAAQARVAKSLVADPDVDSAAEWLARNRAT